MPPQQKIYTSNDSEYTSESDSEKKDPSYEPDYDYDSEEDKDDDIKPDYKENECLYDKLPILKYRLRSENLNNKKHTDKNKHSDNNKHTGHSRLVLTSAVEQIRRTPLVYTNYEHKWCAHYIVLFLFFSTLLFSFYLFYTGYQQDKYNWPVFINNLYSYINNKKPMCNPNDAPTHYNVCYINKSPYSINYK